jgi:hypothetical protein
MWPIADWCVKGGGQIMEKFKFAVVFLFAITMFTAACSSQQASPAGNAIPTPSLHHGVPMPVKIALLQDVTPSTIWTGTPTLTITDIDPLLDMLCRRGGEIGFGLISDDSDYGLVRLRVELPPAQPTAPSKSGNPYKVAEKFASYERDMEVFRDKFTSWHKRTEGEKNKFRNCVDQLLKRKRHAKCTDVWLALKHAYLFLSEEDAWGQKTSKFVLLISDGEDNVRREKIKSMNGAKLIIVNATGTIGSLTGLHPLRFESIASAVRFITAEKEEEE